MQRFLEIFCCNWSAHSRDEERFDSGLLSPPMGDLIHPNNYSRGGCNLLVDGSQEDEDIIHSIFDVFSNAHAPNVEGMKTLLWEALELIKQGNVRVVVLSNLLEGERAQAKSGEQLLEHIKCLVSTLEHTQRRELATLIQDLPSAVLGDTFAKEQSRVLIDLNTDVKESVKDDKVKVVRKKKLVTTITEMLLQTLSLLSSPERIQVLVYILSKQNYPLRLKIVLQHLFLSRLVSASVTSREKLVHSILDLE